MNRSCQTYECTAGTPRDAEPVTDAAAVGVAGAAGGGWFGEELTSTPPLGDISLGVGSSAVAESGCKDVSNPVRIDSLQHTAIHCHTLPHTATHCNTLQHTGVHG